MLWWRCPSAYVHDGQTGQWWRVGSKAAPLPPIVDQPDRASPGFTLNSPDGLSADDRCRFVQAAVRAVEFVHAGDVFQVNLSHTLRGHFRGSSRELFADLMAQARPWYGAYVEDVPRPEARAALVSMSPELFIDHDAHTRRVVTRPIKGTRSADLPDHALGASEKDAAELAMIVDLMRNDLGRVCEFGSIRVVQARAFERHARASIGPGSGGVLHGVATIEGRLRDSLEVADLLRATFPAGSITGAPKVRAMQIIDQLESPAHPRGPYTGSIGYVSDGGHACFNVAIRTVLVAGRPSENHDRIDTIKQGRWTYSAGAGIVADSDPSDEWDETLTKSEIILNLESRTPSTNAHSGDRPAATKFAPVHP